MYKFDYQKEVDRIIKLFYEHKYTAAELQLIYDFCFLLYTGDLDLIENRLKYRINKCKKV